MPTIRRRWKQRGIVLLIPGGWEAVVPQIIEQEPHVMSKAWAEYLCEAKVVFNQFEGMQQATTMHQNVYNYAWRVLLSQSIFYWAKEYGKRYPECLEKIPNTRLDRTLELKAVKESKFELSFNHYHTYTLTGYDPAVMQHAFVPAQKPGVDGLQFVDAMLREMHDE